MAENATLYRVELQVADMDRNYFNDFNLRVALHPSETVERMMVRILAFCYRAEENLTFTKGLSSMDEPDLWRRHDNGTLEEWIEVGQPSLERLKKASSQSQKVIVFSYGRGMDVWWKQQRDAISALPKVSMYYFESSELQSLTQLAAKSMKLVVTITESIAYVSTETDSLSIQCRILE